MFNSYLFWPKYGMKRTLIIKRIDYLFLYTILFFISFVVLSYFIKSRILCFLSSFALGFMLFIVIKTIFTKRQNYNLAKKQDLENISKLTKNLICGGSIFALEYLKTVLNGKIQTFGVESEDCVYYIDFSKPELTLFDVNRIRCSIFSSSKKKYIVANGISPQLKDFLSGIDVEVEFLSVDKLYFEYIKDKAALPSLDIKQKNPTKNTLKSIVKIAFSKSKAKGYFINGILIFIFSFLYPFKNYYLVFSLVLFLFALVCVFEPFRAIDS